ncbi:unnamed protein product [Ixodes hexagonus]
MPQHESDDDGAGCHNWLQLRNMKSEEVGQVTDIWEEQGLGQGANNVKNFYQLDPEGFFVAVDTRTGEVVATCACVRQNPSLFVVGQYAVRKRLQGSGVGLRLWKLMDLRLGDCNAGLSAVPSRLSTYRDRAGFRVVEPWKTIVYKTTRVTPDKLPVPPDNLRLVPINETLMPQVCNTLVTRAL